MRVLSRRSNLPKAVACGYSEGAGFVCSNGTLPLALCPPLAPHVGDPSTRRWRAVSPGPRGCAHSGCAYSARCRSGPHQQEAERAATWGRRPLLDGVGEVCNGRRDRALGCVGLSPLQLGPSRPPISNSRGTLRRRRAPPKTPPDALGERSPAPATAAAALWFQPQRQNGTAVAHARRHKHCSTAAATTAGVVHRSLHCTRDRERCTES